MTTQWGEFRNFINANEIGHIFTRSYLLSTLAPKGFWPSTIDTYRNLLCRSGFLSHLGRAKYKLSNLIPEGLTMEEAIMLANGDNLSYVERLYKRKMKKILKRYHEKAKANQVGN